MTTSRKNIFIIIVIAGSLFMEMLDTTIINTAIPQIASSFHVNALALKLAVTSYLISLAVFIPVCGWIADRFGTQKVFFSAILLFIVSSFLCGHSNNLFQLSCFRALQGLAGALMTPVARLIMVRTFPPQELVKVTTYIFFPALIGPLVGPFCGGFFATYSSWRFIFYINIPIGIILALITLKFVTNEVSKTRKKLDIIGFVLSAVGLSFTSFSMETMNEPFFKKEVQSFLLYTGLLCVVLYIVYSSVRKENSIMNLSLFKIRTFRYGILGSLFTLMVLGGIQFLLPLMFQLQFGKSPLVSGALLIPFALGALLMRGAAPKIVDKFGFKVAITIASIGNCIFLYVLTFFSKETPIPILCACLFIQGFFAIMMLSTCGPLAYAVIKKIDTSHAATIDATLRQFCTSISIGITALSLSAFLSLYHVNIYEPLAMKAFKNTFLVLSIFFLLAFFVSLLIRKEDGKIAP